MSVCFSSFSSAVSFTTRSEHLFRLRRARIVCMEGKELQQFPKTELIGFKEIRFGSSTETERPFKESKFTAFFLHGLLGSGEELTAFSHSLASSLSDLSVSGLKLQVDPRDYHRKFVPSLYERCCLEHLGNETKTPCLKYYRLIWKNSPLYESAMFLDRKKLNARNSLLSQFEILHISNVQNRYHGKYWSLNILMFYVDWRMVLLDLRNHGSSVGREGLSPPHDMVNAARDLANLVVSLNWAWPDILIGHSLGAKVALQYALSCSQGDYGASAQLPIQLWLLDAAPGALKFTGTFEEMERALHTVETLPSQIPSHEWLVNHMIELGYSKRVGERLAGVLKKSGEYEILPFNAYGAVRMFTSARDMDYWAFVEHLPKGMEVAFIRTEMWDEQLVERLERIAARESDESTGKVSVHVVPNSGHWIHKDQPERLLEIMTPKIASLAQAKS